MLAVDDMPWIRPDQAVDPDYWRAVASYLRHPQHEVAGSSFWRQDEADRHADVCEWRAWALDRTWADAATLSRLMGLCPDGHSLDSGLFIAVGRP